MKRVVVIDSALNVPLGLLEKHGIAVVPVSLTIDDKPYREDVDATRGELVDLIAKSNSCSTSQPAPGEFVEVYESLAGADEVLSIHITGKLSGTLQTADIGAEMITGKHITTFDSESASMGGGWLALAAATMFAEGKGMEQVVETLREMRPQVGTYLSLPTLKYLQKSGRVGLGKSLLAGLLSVKPVFQFSEGLLAPVSKARSMAGAGREMVSLLKQTFGDTALAVAILHAADEAGGTELEKMARSELNVSHLLVEDLTASLVVHGGPGTLAITAVPYHFVEKALS